MLKYYLSDDYTTPCYNMGPLSVHHGGDEDAREDEVGQVVEGSPSKPSNIKLLNSWIHFGTLNSENFLYKLLICLIVKVMSR